MPVSIAGIGESDNTPIKNETVAALFSAWCSQVSVICQLHPRPVRYVDLTAGCGLQRSGQPTFIRTVGDVAGRHGLDVELLALEQDDGNAESLRSFGMCDRVLTMRWQEAMPQIVEFCRGAYAFVYHDPNACKEEHVAIAELASQVPYADLCLHFDANQIKRIRCAGMCVLAINELATIRPHCLIRQPYGVGSQWTIMYLSRCSLNGYAKYGFYRLEDNETGQAILRRMQLTKREIERERERTNRQGVLFES